MKLVPDNVDIYEQFRRRNQFVRMVERWAGKKSVSGPYCYKVDVKLLEEESGIRCEYLRQNLVRFELVDQKAYTMWLMRWS
jgi:hypothetical protein